MGFFTPFEMPTGAAIPARRASVADFGAVPGGRVNNTRAFAAAIDHLAALGGGRVDIPGGKWLTGPIHLKSGIELHTQPDTEVLFSTERTDYLPPVPTLFEGVRCYTHSAQLYAYQCHDIAVTGQGTFNGQGFVWWYLALNRAGVEALYREYSDYAGQANTQTDANLLSQWPYLVWDTELNSLWGRLKDALSADVMEELRNEEINWIRFRDEAAQEAVRSFEGGSIYPMLYTLEQAALTRNRACFLASMLSRAVNEPFELPPRGVCGQYLDTGGTAAVYKRLVIAAGMESGYTAALFVSGTGTLEGEAEPAGEGKIAFTSYDGKVEGVIVYGWTGASFTVTRSDGGPFGLGEVYILPTAL